MFLLVQQKLQDNVSVLNTASSNTSATKFKTIICKYNEDYLLFGFIYSEANLPHPTCIICDKTLANEAMVPNKLEILIVQTFPLVDHSK